MGLNFEVMSLSIMFVSLVPMWLYN
jgi:hypothetical protein